ncbi:MAG: hypothetical protein IJJ01_03035 [Firmicutes bacterium]|nr:hypothetical protein [Bacillota bacterium]
MKIFERILTGVSVVLVMLGIASIESTPVFIPLLMILGGGAWIVYAANAYKWD